MIMSYIGIAVMLILFGALIKVFINTYDSFTEEEKKDVALALRDQINNRIKSDSIL